MIPDNVIPLAVPGADNKAELAAERELIKRAGRGDRQAFRQIVETNKQHLFQLALGVVRDRDLAEDVLQEAFLKAYKALPEFRGDSRLATWLHRITFLTAIDCTRREKRRPGLDDAAIEPEALEDQGSMAAADAQLQTDQTMRQISRAMQMLTPLEQSVFSLRHMQNFKLRDIAEIVNRPEGTVKNALFSAIRKMRQQLLEAGEYLQEVNRC